MCLWENAQLAEDAVLADARECDSIRTRYYGNAILFSEAPGGREITESPARVKAGPGPARGPEPAGGRRTSGGRAMHSPKIKKLKKTKKTITLRNVSLA